MKYMGSKRWQLNNGLGTQIRRVARPTDRFVDLFSGSGVVSWFASEQLGLPVTAVDLQQYAVVVTASVIERSRTVGTDRLIDTWIAPARVRLEQDDYVCASRLLLESELSPANVERMRNDASSSVGVFTASYGGYYFSLEQARTLDELRLSLPKRKPASTVCLAALIVAASRCSASPGHTAQPFRPTPQALPHIEAIWRRDLLSEVQRVLEQLAARHAVARGTAIHGDANAAVRALDGGELVFADPPYSAAQYSRFYHVLEAVATGGYRSVHGAGRAPEIVHRPSSRFSRVTTARTALTELLTHLAEKECRVIATFPQYKASNGLSGEEIAQIAGRWFNVDVCATSNRFSTLGGNGTQRAARHRTQELILTMFPR